MKGKNNKKVLSVALAFAMGVSLLPTSSFIGGSNGLIGDRVYAEAPAEPAISGPESVEKGGSGKYTVSNADGKTITWSVEGNTSTGTSIDNSGNLTVGANETGNLKVKARVADDIQGSNAKDISKDVAPKDQAAQGSAPQVAQNTSYTLSFGSYSIESIYVNGNSVSGNNISVKAGDTISVTAYSDYDYWYYRNHGYRYGGFSNWTVSGLNLSNWQLNGKTLTFTMPSNNVTVTPNYYNGTNWWGDEVYPTNRDYSAGSKVSGRLSSYPNTVISVYYDGSFIGSGWTDSNGYYNFSISGGNYSYLAHQNYRFFVGDRNYNYYREVRVYPTNTNEYGNNASGRLSSYPNEKVSVYYNGSFIGSGWTNANGWFDFSLNGYYNIGARANFQYYIGSGNAIISRANGMYVTAGLPGSKTLSGKGAGNGASITVKDSNGYIIGTSVASSTGEFTVTLSRALVAQETIKVYSNINTSISYVYEYIVPYAMTEDNTTSSIATTSAYIKGMDKDYFRPQYNVTRGEAVAMIARLVNGSENFGDVSSVTKFYDANNAWYSKALNYAISKGLVKGYADGEFKPDENITRAQFVTMLESVIKKNDGKTANFNDVKSGFWAYNAIQKAYAAGVIKGYANGEFKPNEKITRAEAVTVLNLVFDKKAEKYSKSFVDVKPGDWFYTAVMNAAN